MAHKELAGFVDGLQEVRNTYPAWPLSRLSVLLMIGDSPGIRMAELEQRLSLAQTTVWRHVHYLEETGGFVAAVRCPTDARAFEVYPTRKGEAFLRRVCGQRMGQQEARP
ncbi:MarR family transcriptional regulator [Magnetospirillum fulvum]|uniref:MarR family transcriptional regulator n=1 Tax=Magnetospirillum fulvum TaxID=1082 RepID=UPI00111529DA